MIRDAAHEDVGAIVDIAAKMHAESRFSVLTFAPEKVERVITRLIDGKEFVKVFEVDGRVVGGLAAMMFAHWASHDEVASDVALFILPEYRGTSSGARLLKMYRDWAEGNGAKMITAGINTAVDSEKTRAMYACVGFETVGFICEGAKNV
jgi:GNAT superfamily N-acetyltransferase